MTVIDMDEQDTDDPHQEQIMHAIWLSISTTSNHQAIAVIPCLLYGLVLLKRHPVERPIEMNRTRQQSSYFVKNTR